MKIILSNNTELTPILVTGASRFVQGSSRDTLTFVFPESEDITALDAVFTAENCESITIIGDDESEAIHKGYTIRAELAKTPMEVEPATAETEAVYENRITVAMSQRTYMETQLAEQQAILNTLLGE